MKAEWRSLPFLGWADLLRLGIIKRIVELPMWYVVQTRTGTEESIRIQCQKNVSAEVLARCFIPYYEEQKRIRGEWTTQTKVLFPGYVFMITENVEALYLSLIHISSDGIDEHYQYFS